METKPSLPSFSSALASLAARVKAGKATGADFGFASLLHKISDFPSAEAKVEAGASLGALRLYWTLARAA